MSSKTTRGLTCEIQWIDADGHPTPDCRRAIGVAWCGCGRDHGPNGNNLFPICEEHAGRLPKSWHLIRFATEGCESHDALGGGCDRECE